MAESTGLDEERSVLGALHRPMLAVEPGVKMTDTSADWQPVWRLWLRLTVTVVTVATAAFVGAIFLAQFSRAHHSETDISGLSPPLRLALPQPAIGRACAACRWCLRAHAIHWVTASPRRLFNLAGYRRRRQRRIPDNGSCQDHQLELTWLNDFPSPDASFRSGGWRRLHPLPVDGSMPAVWWRCPPHVSNSEISTSSVSPCSPSSACLPAATRSTTRADSSIGTRSGYLGRAGSEDIVRPPWPGCSGMSELRIPRPAPTRR